VGKTQVPFGNDRKKSESAGGEMTFWRKPYIVISGAAGEVGPAYALVRDFERLQAALGWTRKILER
jgi:hypothetical protein